jgi:hypothetical protein
VQFKIAAQEHSLSNSRQHVDPEFNQTAKQHIGDAGNWVRFHGRLLPEVAFLSLGTPVHILLDGLSGIKIAFEISMSNSQVYVLCLTTESHLQTIRNYVTDQVQVLIDAYGFLNGFWADVDIRTAAPTAKPFTSFSLIVGESRTGRTNSPLILVIDKVAWMNSSPKSIVRSD